MGAGEPGKAGRSGNQSQHAWPLARAARRHVALDRPTVGACRLGIHASIGKRRTSCPPQGLIRPPAAGSYRAPGATRQRQVQLGAKVCGGECIGPAKPRRHGCRRGSEPWTALSGSQGQYLVASQYYQSIARSRGKARSSRFPRRRWAAPHRPGRGNPASRRWPTPPPWPSDLRLPSGS